MSKNLFDENESDFFYNQNNKKLKTYSDSAENEAGDLELEDENETDLIIKSTEVESFYGIKERINKNVTRFDGLIKQNSADFIVNEIDLDGNVVRLTNFDLPVFEIKQNVNEESNIDLDVSLLPH
jgi:hypothetical protein